jgi:CDP-diacylglycerol---glycerol-3-phosphate 3-phosphatidyltransferase
MGHPTGGAGAPVAGDGTRDPRPSAWNVANALTGLRIALVPVFGWLLLAHGGHQDAYRIAAFAVFAVAAATDQIDGDIARRRGIVTDLGKIADPIADKALTGMAFVGLSILGDLAWWVTVAVLVREWGITALRFAVIRFGVIAASHGGKLKTLLQGLALSGYILPLSGWLHTAAMVVMAAAVVVTLITGVDYVRRALTLRRAGRLAAKLP